MAKNTLLMYLRMFIIIIVQLYTVPLVLHALGAEDYGVYNVVGGFVTMFTFINGSLVSGCQRYMAYSIGEGNKQKLRSVFETSFFIFLVLSIFLFVLLEVVGVWFLNTHMTIPDNRIEAANWVLQLSIFSMIITILSTPYNAAVIAHEKLSFFAYVSIFEGVYKLLIAFLLVIVLADKLIVYAWLILSSALFVASFYFFYCRRSFSECKGISLIYDQVLLKDIGSYAGWNVIGAMAVMFRNHGLNIVMNLFFSPLLNAAHTIAAQINGLFNQFVNNVYVATRPQMTKQYAMGNINEMWKITYGSSKYAFFLMSFIVIPVIIELPMFLKLWLRDVPDYTVAFSRLMLISLVVETMTNQIIGAFQAANRIKCFQSVSSVILLSVVPLSYISLRILSNPIVPYIIYVIVSVVYIVSLIIIAYRQLHMDIFSYFNDVIKRDICVITPSFILTYFLVNSMQDTYWRIPITLLISFLLTTIFIWTIGLNSSERKYIRNYISGIIKKNK